jgi:hypothetical protein
MMVDAVTEREESLFVDDEAWFGTLKTSKIKSEACGSVQLYLL